MATQCWLSGPPATLIRQHHNHHHHNNNNNSNHHNYNHHHNHHRQQQQQQQPNATQQQQTFISSNAYYGYVPVTGSTLNNNNNNTVDNNNIDAAGMDVDVEDCRMQAQEDTMMFGKVDDDRCNRARKRCIGQEEFNGYAQGFKRFREGGGNECHFTGTREQHQSNNWFHHSYDDDNKQQQQQQYYSRLAPLQHETLLCLSATVESTRPFQRFQHQEVMTDQDNLKLQHQQQQIGMTKIQDELEDKMLLLTHGCSPYHHYRHSQAALADYCQEAEF